MFTNTFTEQNHTAQTRRIRLRLNHAPVQRLLEQLESRVLLSATLFVTDPSVATDPTHFHTVQSALAFANDGDTVMLQSGFNAGVFSNTALSANATAGLNSIHTTAALDVGEVISIGNGGADTIERALVTAVTPTLLGDYMITLANNLLFNHASSAVHASDSPTIGINKSIMLVASSGVTVPFNLEIWGNTTNVTLSKLAMGGNSLTVDSGASFNSVANSTFASVTLATGSNNNTFTSNTVGDLTAVGTLDSNGNDTFNQNTFTGHVVITGNDTADTGDAIINNTFSASSGDALTLHSTNSSLVQHNTFTNSGTGARSLVIDDSDNVIVTSNTITPTGTSTTGIYITVDNALSTGVDVTNNVIHTGTGTAVSIVKLTSNTTLEVRLQSNDLTGNAMGVAITGDGTSAGNIDLGGDTDNPTSFDASIGDNDFSSYTSADAIHFAVGLFNTSAGYTVFALGNHFTVADPTTLVADGSDDAAANGSGVIAFTNVVQPSETLTGSVSDIAAIQTATTTGVIATFFSNLSRVAADFTVSIDWGDGSTSVGTVVANNTGGFDVVASHQWNKAGSFDFSLSVSTPDSQATVGGTATITPRLLVATGKDFTGLKKNAFNGVIATFTDNLGGTSATLYKSTIIWSDGVTSTGTITKNADGSYSVKTSRTFKAAGAFIATITVSTVDGLFSASATANGTITGSDNGTCHHPIIRHIFHVILCHVKAHCCHTPSHAPVHSACHH